MAKKKIPAVVEAPATGVQRRSPETHIANLKELNNLLIKDTVEYREEIHKLQSKLDSLAADHDILDAIQGEVFRDFLSSSLFDAAELATAKLNAVAREKDGIERDMKLVVEERDLSRRNVDVKRKDLKILEETILFMEEARDHELKEREVGDAKCGKLEEELQSVMFEKDLLKRSLEFDKHLADKLVKEMEVMKCQQIVDMGILKENASKISALKEECRFLEENRGQLEKKVENMKRMEAAKNLVDQRNENYEIQIRSLQAEILELQFARKSLEDAHSSCIQNIDAVQREKNLKVEEAVALKMQLNDSMKSKHIMEQKLEVLQKNHDHQTTENEETKKHINSLMVEKASLEQQFETSNQNLKNVEKKLKSLDDASGQVFALLKKVTAEVMPSLCINSETGVEVDNNVEMKLFLSNLEVLKLAVKGKDTKINDLNRKLVLLQLSVASLNNKGGKWKWFFPATSIIFAVVSLAYAAGR